MTKMEAKQQREQEFHDRIFADGTRADASKYYSVLRNSRLFFESFINARTSGQVLEYGCGPGSYAFHLSKRGAAVTGIDISQTAITMATAQAEASGCRDIRFIKMDAERLEFQPRTFDLVCGIAILHHLDLDKAFRELARTMKQTGAAVFMEPLGHNPIINLYRRLTPQLRTVDEHPLTMGDINVAHRYFNRVEAQFFTLNSLFAVPLRNTSVFNGALNLLEQADKTLFKHVPPLRRYAWQVVLTLSEPRAL
jgi:ubiquinone/menaquinone biosynthesis C-methylase UbiE